PSIMRLNTLSDDEELEEEKSKVKTPYDDLWDLDKNEKPVQKKQKTRRKIPPKPEKDLLLFIEKYSRELEDWQCDILTMMREEMLYFWSQLETKIMNEGWASYWHQRILRELDLTSGETIEFAELNANVIQPSKTQINPYYLGLKMFESIEKQYDNPSEEMKKRGIQRSSGRKKIFEVREMDNDQSFIRNYLTKELAEQEDLYLFQKEGNEYRVSSKEFENIREQLISSRVNGGFPYIVVKDGDYLRNGELYLEHRYEGVELGIEDLEKVLPYLFSLSGRAIHLETAVNDKQMLYSYDGQKVYYRYL